MTHRSFAGVSALVTLALATSACQRSAQFRQDQDYIRADTPLPAAQPVREPTQPGPAQKVESLGQPKKRIVVLDFWNDTPVKQNDLGRFAADEVRRALYMSQRVIVPTDLKIELATQDFVQGDQVRVSQLMREGRRMGVAVIVIGRISRIVFRQRGDDVGLFRQKQSIAAVDVEMKLFDVITGREVVAVSRSGEANTTSMVILDPGNLDSPQFRNEMTRTALKGATAQLIPDVLRSVEKLAWEGHIARVNNSKVFVSAGRASGLVPGDILKVMSQGDDVYDPGTGAYLGRAEGQLKGTLEVVDFIGPDAAVAEVHSGANFQEGDRVQLY